MGFYQENADVLNTVDALWLHHRKLLDVNPDLDMWEVLEDWCPRWFKNDGKPRKAFVYLEMDAYDHHQGKENVIVARDIKANKALSRILRVVEAAKLGETRAILPMKQKKYHQHLTICTDGEITIVEPGNEKKEEDEEEEEEEEPSEEIREAVLAMYS